MKRLKKADFLIIIILALIVAGIVLTVCSAGRSSVKPGEAHGDATYEDYKGKRIGIRTGSSFEDLTLKYFPGSDYSYFDTDSDLLTALTTGKIDGFLDDEPVAGMMHIENSGVDYIREKLVDDDYCFVFSKGSDQSAKIRTEFNETLKKLRENGYLDQMKSKWMNSDESVKTYDKEPLTGGNGTVRVSVAADKIPFSYVSNDELTGYNIELLTIFCREHGYKYEIEMTQVTGILAGVSSGRYDIGAGLFSVTEERKKTVDFSDSIYNGGVVLVGRSDDISSSGSDGGQNNSSFVSTVSKSFEKNFIQEARYKLILRGILITCTVTGLSVIAGTLLAFLICLFRRTDSILAGKIANLYIKILQGTPMVVLLMILYYVVFGRVGINALWVAVTGFSLNFAAYTAEIMRTGIEGVDKGQREAALALGYSENQAFFKFIFPQAAVRQIPVYRGEIISMMKNTSIVGYIAIQDLTKMSDIIRSRTYEAFFPLIVTALIYFILAWIISLLLKLLLSVIDPRSAGTKKSKEMAK